ncbi:MAG: DNA recombination protein RmuC, partial [Alphaproteobacteria bacterium]|nr:DNA recombination protein RmuC [Alphaproteobacteria bacterium]
KLAEKRYWSQFNRAPGFVIAFVPSEGIFSAALQQDPNLIEAGAEKNVVLATPTTLIALLRSVAYGWRQEEVLRNAEEISRLGKQLYDRLRTLCEHFAKLGNSLNSTVKHYNAAVGAFESRVLTGARKFRDLGAAATGELEELPVIETMPRELLSPEMLALPSSTEN